MVDLSTLTGNYTTKNNETLTGTPKGNYKITIKDGATVTLNGVTIEGEDEENYNWVGCEGNPTVILASKNIAKGFYVYHPGIYVLKDKTLTIKGKGALNASSNRLAACIGKGQESSCSKITLGYTKASDYIIANEYIAGQIAIVEGRTFIVEGNSTKT